MHRFNKIVYYNIVLVSCLILSTRIATVIHEVLGHALVAVLSGGSVFQVSVSLFGGGITKAVLGNDHVFIRFFFSLSGILLNIVTGMLPILFIKKIEKLHLSFAMLLFTFSLSSLHGALAYLVMGLYYNTGDPVNWVDSASHLFPFCWVPFLFIAPFVSFKVLRLYIPVQERIFPTKTFKGRLYISSVTLGISFFIYALLFYYTNQSLVSINASAYDHQRSKRIMIQQKKEQLFQKLSEANPDLTKEEISRIVENTSISVEDEEIPDKFPVAVLLILFSLAGGLYGLKRINGIIYNSVGSVSPYNATVMCILAIAIVLLLVSTNGVLFKG